MALSQGTPPEEEPEESPKPTPKNPLKEAAKSGMQASVSAAKKKADMLKAAAQRRSERQAKHKEIWSEESVLSKYL